jgi:hypothetical protein
MPFENNILRVLFRQGPRIDGPWSEYLDPDSSRDIERYVLEMRYRERNETEDKIPMVEECRRKGADYLIT